MRTSLLGVGVLLALSGPGAGAQSNPVQVHIIQVAFAFADTPGGQGLLTTAIAEAAIAARHVELANQAGTSLGDVQLHVGHMLHAVDPTLAIGGPGLGYGVRSAASSAAAHLTMAASDSSASENVRLHVEHIAVILANVLGRVDEMTALAQQILAATSIATASPLLTRLTTESETLVGGRDLNGDGRIGWQAGEGGLRQAMFHLRLLERGEGLAP
jgi:hypothetical protein